MLSIVAVIVALAGVLPGTATYHPESREIYTTYRFEIVPENVERVVKIAPGPGHTTIVMARVAACPAVFARHTGRRPHQPLNQVKLVVSGLPAGAFHPGQLIATGVDERRGDPIGSIRSVGERELARIGCTL